MNNISDYLHATDMYEKDGYFGKCKQCKYYIAAHGNYGVCTLDAHFDKFGYPRGIDPTTSSNTCEEGEYK